MTITLEIPQEIERQIRERATAAGVSVGDFASSLLVAGIFNAGEAQRRLVEAKSTPQARHILSMSIAERLATLQQIFEAPRPLAPALPDDAFDRAELYP